MLLVPVLLLDLVLVLIVFVVLMVLMVLLASLVLLVLALVPMLLPMTWAQGSLQAKSPPPQSPRRCTQTCRKSDMAAGRRQQTAPAHAPTQTQRWAAACPPLCPAS